MYAGMPLARTWATAAPWATDAPLEPTELAGTLLALETAKALTPACKPCAKEVSRLWHPMSKLWHAPMCAVSLANPGIVSILAPKL